MPYSEILIKPMREDLTRIGVEETRTPEQVEEAINKTEGTLLVVVNSVSAAGPMPGREPPPARPALPPRRPPRPSRATPRPGRKRRPAPSRAAAPARRTGR